MTVAVVGPGSLVAGALRRARASAGWRFVRWQDAVAADDWLDGVSCVVNCAYDPRLRAGAPYDPALDVDLRIARRVSARPGTLQLMLSTRAAYGPAGADPVLREDRPPAPDRPYGASKLATERALGALLGERLTVLRLSNVFGDEAVPGRRTFVGVALATLRERGAIVLDIDPGVARDFVPVSSVASRPSNRLGTIHFSSSSQLPRFTPRSLVRVVSMRTSPARIGRNGHGSFWQPIAPGDREKARAPPHRLFAPAGAPT